MAGRERTENVFPEEEEEKEEEGGVYLPFNLLNSSEQYFMVVLWSPRDSLM